MNAGRIILHVASKRRDAQNDSDGAVLRSSVAAATPSQHSVAAAQQAAAAPSQQHYNLALNWSSHRRVPPRGAAGSTSRRDAAAPRGGTRAGRAAARSISEQLRRSSISSVAAAEAGDGSVPRRLAVDGDYSFEIVPAFTRRVIYVNFSAY